jgi:hypothetical protein
LTTMGAPAGGFSDKLGNRYEAQYVVMAALDLVDGDRQTIRWEGVGDEFDGVEYRSRLQDGTVEVVQCKSNRDKHWTIAALSEKVVPTAMRTQLSGHADRFTLVLAGRSPDLAALCQRAAGSSDVLAFEQSLSKPHATAFGQLLSAWELSGSTSDKDIALGWLRRIEVQEHATPEAVDRLSEKRCADLFDGPGATTRATIREVLEENLGQEFTADLLISSLRSDRYRITPRDWARLPDQVQAVQDLRDRFLRQLGRLLVRRRLIPRSESDAVLKAIAASEGPRVVLVHGAAGNGKSGVLYEVVRRLTDEGTCVVPLRLDNQLPSGNLLRYSREVLLLPNTPVQCAARLSAGRRSVIVVDQLDAVRWAGVHSSSAWDVTLELLDAAVRARDVVVVVACRTFDIKDDPNLRAWRKEQAVAGRILEVEVKPLDVAVVEKVVAESGAPKPTATQVALLRNPLMLALWCRLSDAGSDLSGISGSSQLLREHWKSIKRRLADRHGVPDDVAEQVVACVRTWAESQGHLDFPAELVSNQTALDALASESYLDRLDSSRFRVAHQRYLDYQIALGVFRETVSAGGSLAQWLRGTEQSLMRREQVRQVLGLLRDGDVDAYARGIEELLLAEGVREHLRDLVLRLLAEAAPPLGSEVSLVCRLVDDERWTRRIRARTLTTPVWWRVLLDRGVLQSWLLSPDKSDWNWAGWTCGQLGMHDQRLISDLLVSLAKDSRLTQERKLRCLPIGSEHDTPVMAKWRFAAQRRGEFRFERYEIVSAAKEHPSAGLRYAMHIVRWQIAHVVRPGLMPKGPPDRFDRYSSERGPVVQALRSIAAALPRDTWGVVVPHLLRHLRWLDRRRRGLEKTERRLPWDYPSRSINGIMRIMLEAAAKHLAAADLPWMWRELEPFLALRSLTAARLAVAVATVVDGPISDKFWNWVLVDLRRTGVNGSRYDLRRYCSARPLVRRLWDADSGQRARLLRAVSAFHDPYELKQVRTRREYVRAGRPDLLRNEYGLPQYLLLSALPHDALDATARFRLEQWDAKFCRRARRLRRARPKGWYLCAPADWKAPSRRMRLRSMQDLIPAANTARVPDGDWIEMANPRWAQRMVERWKRTDRASFDTPEGLTEAAFRVAAKSNPARFVRLAKRLPPGAADHWFEVALDAASQTEPDKNLAGQDWRPASAAEAEELLTVLKGRDGRYLAITLGRLVYSRPGEAWSDATIDRLCELAVSHEDPPLGEFSTHAGDGTVSASHVISTGINCVRGVALEAIEHLMWKRRDKRAQFVEVARRAMADPHPSVRSVAIGLVGPLLNDEPDTALGLLETACGGDDLRVLHSPHLGHLLRYLWWREDPRVEAVIARMASSGLVEEEEHGAFFATVTCLRQGRLREVVERCATGTVAQRKGCASAHARLVDPTPDGRKAADGLPAFFDDPEADVAGAAASVFRDDEVMRSPLGPELAAKFVGSEQFGRDPDDLVFPLQEYAGDLLPFQPVLADIVDRATTDMSGVRGDMRRKSFGFADHVSECVLRIYERAQAEKDAKVRSWCLDRFDALIAAGDYFGERALAALDADS